MEGETQLVVGSEEVQPTSESPYVTIEVQPIIEVEKA
jgi:hypothetical protein